MRIFFSFLILLFVSNSSFSQAQDSLATKQESHGGKITAEVTVDRNEVPQNQRVTFTIRISWQGDLDRYEIGTLEKPILNNLEILSTSSSNWVGETEGIKRATKTFDFLLRPMELGMAYIDAMIIEYRDSQYDEKHSLVTNRLEVKVVDPILESDNTLWFVSGAALLVIALVAMGGVSFLKRKKAKVAELRKQELAAIPVEVAFLSELNEKIDLKSADPVASFSELSKLLKRYLSEKYQIAALETTSREIRDGLNRVGVSEKLLEQTDEVLKSCDIAKFSGGDVERATLERCFTLVEDILSRNKNEQNADLTENKTL
ncbi:MAG: BatD family protein [bacterium]